MAPGLPVGISLVRPVIALNVWTFAMEGWMYLYRLPAISKYRLKMTPQLAKTELNTKIPPESAWAADNYNHLHEQPTTFYATALSLCFMGLGDDSTLNKLAWTYVGIRVIHSVVQTMSNHIPTRFSLFLLSGLVLLGMTGKGAQTLFF